LGGGYLKAINGAWAAIRAYGEFVTPNYGVVNFNVTKDKDGNPTGAGNHIAQITGDLVTNGGMGTKGRINVGLNGKDSWWEGNYADTRGYGETPGEFGAVNLFMKNGSHWLGFGNGSMNIQMDGSETYWNGFGMGDSLQLTLNNGSTWYNAIWKGTAINSGDALNLYMANGSTWTNTGASTVKSITADKSYIVMGKDASLNLGSFSGNADIFYQMNGKDIQGGDVTIANATKGSSLSMVADIDGTDITTGDYTTILDNLAKKLYYTAGDTHLSGYVKIAEGLTSASVTKALGGIDFDRATGQGSYEKFASSQSKFIYSTAIKGHMTDDMDYVKTGVLDTATNTYNFIKNETTITAENSTVSGGPWVGRVGSAVAGIDDTTTLDMHGHTLTVREANAGHSTGITAIGTRGKVEINNAGAMDISASGTGQTAALFVNGGGQIAIHNGDSDKAVLRLRANASNKANGAVIKSMNGVANAASQITIDGLVDVVADGQNSNEAVSAVASTINIGGGIVTAEDGAAWAIRAYGEFSSPNVGTVNINTTQDSAGNMNGAGSRKTQITGNLSTAGGMGNKGQINIGLSGKDSFLKGDYATATGTEVEAHTQAATGLNLYLSNGADWTGNTKGSTTLTMNANTTWHGQSTSSEMAVNMKGAGTWYNTGASIIKHWTSQRSAYQAATIDMTDSKAGDVSIDNYNGNTFVIYKHNEANPSTLTGGKVTIKHADAGSSITMSTDNTGIDTNNIYAVDSVLSALAEKLTYSGYIGKAEDNLKGYVQIAEGLTALRLKLQAIFSSVKKPDRGASTRIAWHRLFPTRANRGAANLVPLLPAIRAKIPNTSRKASSARTLGNIPSPKKAIPSLVTTKPLPVVHGLERLLQPYLVDKEPTPLSMQIATNCRFPKMAARGVMELQAFLPLDWERTSQRNWAKSLSKMRVI
jgi:hypothetical protein